MPASKPTEAQIARAIRAARREGCATVDLWDGAVRIRLDDAGLPDSPPAGQIEPRKWGQAG